jgi:Phosphoinositide 3-kinase C2
MPPKSGGVTGNSGNNNPFQEANDLQQQQQQWVNVTWMPHTALSQTSHVCLTVHSAHVVLLNEDGTFLHSKYHHDNTNDAKEWRIQMSIHGIGNLPLAPISTYTKAATVAKRTRDHLRSSSSQRIITIQKATHECHWDYFAYMPLRWRDLTRDSYLLIEVMRSATTETEDEDEVVYHTTIPFFTQYGKLVTGLQKLRLHRGAWTNPTNRNYGLILDRSIKDDPSDKDDDLVWKSVLILDQLERMETAERGVQQERIHTNGGNLPMSSHKNNALHIDSDNHINNNTFGRISSVPWLDAMMKERAMQEIQNSYCVDSAVSTTASIRIDFCSWVFLPNIHFLCLNCPFRIYYFLTPIKRFLSLNFRILMYQYYMKKRFIPYQNMVPVVPFHPWNWQLFVSEQDQ